jgi:hypothetical protein
LIFVLNSCILPFKLPGALAAREAVAHVHSALRAAPDSNFFNA